VVEWASIVRRFRSSRVVVVAPSALTTAAAAGRRRSLAFWTLIAFCRAWRSAIRARSLASATARPPQASCRTHWRYATRRRNSAVTGSAPRCRGSPAPGTGSPARHAHSCPTQGATTPTPVAAQRGDPDSFLRRFRHLLHLRRSLRPAVDAPVQWLSSGSPVIGYRRAGNPRRPQQRSRRRHGGSPSFRGRRIYLRRHSRGRAAWVLDGRGHGAGDAGRIGAPGQDGVAELAGQRVADLPGIWAGPARRQRARRRSARAASAVPALARSHPASTRPRLQNP